MKIVGSQINLGGCHAKLNPEVCRSRDFRGLQYKDTNKFYSLYCRSMELKQIRIARELGLATDAHLPVRLSAEVRLVDIGL